VTLITSRCLFGAAVREKMFSEVGSLSLPRELNDGMRLVTIQFPHLPIPAHRRRDAARGRLGEIFTEIVRSPKSRTDDDMLQCLIDPRYKDGRRTTETEVVGMLVSALFAGQHNSSSAGTWSGARLLTHTKHLQAAGRGAARGPRRLRRPAGDGHPAPLRQGNPAPAPSRADAAPPRAAELRRADQGRPRVGGARGPCRREPAGAPQQAAAHLRRTGQV